MSSDKSLVVVEAAQPPQVVAVSDVSRDEIEYQRAVKQCDALIEQINVVARPYVILKDRLANTWMTENYPRLSYEIRQVFTATEFGIKLIIKDNTEYPDLTRINRELNEYFAQLER